MKNNTYSGFSRSLSTVKKSQATIPEACASRNWRQLNDALREPGRDHADENGADAGGRNSVPKLGELSLDPAVSPPRILSSQERMSSTISYPTGAPGVTLRTGPFPRHDPPVTTHDGLWSDEVDVPKPAGEQGAQGGEHRSVGLTELRSFDLSAEDRKLVSQDRYLNVLGRLISQTAEKDSQKRASSCKEMKGPCWRLSLSTQFLNPTGRRDCGHVHRGLSGRSTHLSPGGLQAHRRPRVPGPEHHKVGLVSRLQGLLGSGRLKFSSGLKFRRSFKTS